MLVFAPHCLLLVVYTCQGEEVSMDAALSRRVPKERTHEAPPRGELGQALEEAGEGGKGFWVGRVGLGGWGGSNFLNGLLVNWLS